MTTTETVLVVGVVVLVVGGIGYTVMQSQQQPVVIQGGSNPSQGTPESWISSLFGQGIRGVVEGIGANQRESRYQESIFRSTPNANLRNAGLNTNPPAGGIVDPFHRQT